MTGRRAKLEVVPDSAAPAPKDIYADARAAAMDSERWRRVHVESDRAEPIELRQRMRRIFSFGGGSRRERGGFKFQERI